ncbi:hypothetical protein ACF09J_29775 [Streptomyces sp. NPDC014889]|uniref:hypothetical protein n=1 Tax=Streptomyces sp. NPDC014889 TaxID=3364928 RepID=UPI0036F7B9F7
MDRHVIANMGAELGRDADFRKLPTEPDAVYDLTDTIDLSALETRTGRGRSCSSRLQ